MPELMGRRMGDWLKWEDLEGKDIATKVISAEVLPCKKYNEDKTAEPEYEDRYVLHFEGIEAKLELSNATNHNAYIGLMKAAGNTDTDQPLDVILSIVTHPNGKKGILLKSGSTEVASFAGAKPKAEETPEPDGGAAPDDVPF